MKKKPKKFDRIMWCYDSGDKGKYPLFRDKREWAEYIRREDFLGVGRVFKVRIVELKNENRK